MEIAFIKQSPYFYLLFAVSCILRLARNLVGKVPIMSLNIYVERDYDFEDEIIEMEQNFWEKNVQKKIEPPFKEKSDMDLKCLKELLQKDLQ